MNANMTNQGQELKVVTSHIVDLVTGANALVTGAAVNREGFMSGTISLLYCADLSCNDSSYEIGIATSDLATSFGVSETLITGLLTNGYNAINYNINFSSYKKYIQVSTDITRTNDDNVKYACAVIKAGAVKVPV